MGMPLKRMLLVHAYFSTSLKAPRRLCCPFPFQTPILSVFFFTSHRNKNRTQRQVEVGFSCGYSQNYKFGLRLLLDTSDLGFGSFYQLLNGNTADWHHRSKSRPADNVTSEVQVLDTAWQWRSQNPIALSRRFCALKSSQCNLERNVSFIFF